MKSLSIVIIALYGLLGAANIARAQATTDSVNFLSTRTAAFTPSAKTGASLSGVVRDQTGAGLPDVAVTIKNVDTGVTRTVATDRGGHYQASDLSTGRFEIRAAKPGFADKTRTGINL